MQLQPYLYFDGQAEAALEFYKSTFGAEVMLLMRFGASPVAMPMPPGNENKVMHASFRIGDSLLQCSDGNCAGKAVFTGITLHYAAESPEAAESLFGALADGGQIQMPMMQTFFASRFGMVADRFGVSWMITAGAA